MAIPSTVFTEMVATTLRHHRKELIDNVSNHNALFRRLTEKGKVKQVSGGYEIAENLDYAENNTFQRYSGFEPLSVAESNVITSAKYDWKQAAVNVVASGLEIRNNSGKEKMVDLVSNRTKNAMRTFRNHLSIDFYSDGTEDGGKQIGGLQHLVSDSGTGVVGGINSTTYTFWRNVVQSAGAPLQGGGSITPSASTIKSLMQPIWLELCRGGDKPDLIVSSNDYYQYYWDSLTDLQRYGDTSTAAQGFSSLKFVTADVIHDGGSQGGGIPSAHMYFLNTDFLGLTVHKAAYMDTMNERISINQDGVVIPILFQGNLTCSNRSLQGVVKA